jgi:hypothetical protein
MSGSLADPLGSFDPQPPTAESVTLDRPQSRAPASDHQTVNVHDAHRTASATGDIDTYKWHTARSLQQPEAADRNSRPPRDAPIRAFALLAIGGRGSRIVSSGPLAHVKAATLAY